jgi:hypothetical protein
VLRASLAASVVALTLSTATEPPSADAAYSRDGPYLDYATMPPLGKHGEIPKAQYSFGTYYTPVTVAQYGLPAAADFAATGESYLPLRRTASR